MLVGSNVWVADLETGAVDPLFDLPGGISMVDLYGEKPSDAPVRAVFDPDRPVLYYDVLSADVADEDRPILDRYFQLHCENRLSALPEDFEAELGSMAFVREAGLYMLPGIQWSAGDRLLLFDGNINCLYTLAAQP